MKNLFAAAAVAALAGVAQATVIVYTMTGDIQLTAGGDSGGLNGAQFELNTYYDDAGTYINRFGFATVDGTGTVTISGASNGANNTTVSFNENTGWYPTFAGNFSSPDGLQLTFNTGDAQLFTFNGNTTPTPGSGDAFVGGSIELDDFAPGGSYIGVGGTTAIFSADSTYTLNNVSITADYIPAPGTLAFLGLGAFAAGRRRR